MTATSLNLRETPEMTGKKLASLGRGTELEFLEAHNGGEFVPVDSIYAPWLKVRYQSMTGYVFAAYVAGTYNLYFENEPAEYFPAFLNWYGVYRRDSFADVIRPIQVRLASEWNEMYGTTINVLKTNQQEPSKFLVATQKPLQHGYAGPLGLYEVRDMFLTDGLYPGVQLSIHPGQEVGDTTIRPAYGILVSGCARRRDMYVGVTDYMLEVMDYSTQPVITQNLTPWVRPESPEIPPSVSLLWFGDLDSDGRPDAILQDCPVEVGCRASLFLSSFARPNEYLRKVCEHFWAMD